jgi:filamentous hemagglutinin family protein
MRRLLFATTALVPLGLAAAAANPLGGTVVGGSATISGTGTSSVTINQSSQNAVINWNTFNIGSGEKTQFNQPNAQSTVLNRVLGDPNPSQIFGTISANGKVFLINPNGVLIGNGAVINASGFLATTNDITNENFMAGRYNFNIPGRPDASIVNLGTITASNSGFAALVAPGVRNSGTITATFGKIGLASANGFSLDLYGDKLIQLDVNDSIAGSVRDVATGATLKSLVQNDGVLKANGGRVELTAVAARQVVDSVINTSGVIEARSIGQHNGKIVLGAATGASKPAGAPTQTVKVSGKLDASSKKGKGGKVEIVAENIVINDATIDASGQTGGGTVLIGGDIGGGKGNPAATVPLESYTIPTATTVSINGGTVIDASARSTGDGGKVVVWSDGTTSFTGTILARGGAKGGNGGFVETSGHTLAFAGARVDTSAPKGQTGNWLLDPFNLTINPADGATISGNLATTNVFIETTASGTTGPGTSAPGPGDIIVNGDITWSSANTLTLSAFRNIEITGGVAISNTLPGPGTAAGNLILRADNTGSGVGTILLNNGTSANRVDWSDSTGTVSFYYNPTSYSSPTNFLTASGVGHVLPNLAVSGQFTAYMLVNSAANLQAISTNLAGTYALGANIDASSIANFTPLGNISPTQFTGILDGFGGIDVNRTISNLAIAPTSGQTGVGLFGVIGAGGIVRNLNIDSASVTADPLVVGPGQFVGVLAGQNAGSISGVTITNSTITSSPGLSGVGAGGLVGQNGIFGPGGAFGTIASSQAAVNVTLGNAVSLSQMNVAGGLVGSNPGTITGSSASGDIIVGANSSAGGLAGQNGAFGTPGAPGLIDQSSATGNVSSAGINVSLGGLVGFNFFDGTIRDSSYVGGSVTSTVSVPACSGSSCVNATVGGLVGMNEGLIVSTDDFVTSASGTVSVGSHGVAGGLVGFNSGIIKGATPLIGGALSTATVTGASGISNEGGNTVLGGLVGTNVGTIDNSRAEGTVGSPGTVFMLIGGFVGDNTGLITNSIATGSVVAGNFSQAGGFAGTTDAFDCSGCGGFGIGLNNLAKITFSSASGNVTVGSSSVAGGFVGFGSTIQDSSSSGAVTGGANSIVGGFAGGHGVGGLIERASVSETGSVSGGANSWIGGFVGFNAGVIKDSTVLGATSGTSDSLVGGFAGVNIGWIDPSVANGSVNIVGNNNFVGGFVGVNFGTIDNGTASGSLSVDGSNNIVGLFAGANATFFNIAPGQIPFSNFPVGVINNSTGTGEGFPQVGFINPSQLPTYPDVITTCPDEICRLFREGSLIPVNIFTPPTTVQVPPTFLQILSLDNITPLPILAALTTPGGSPGPAGGVGGTSQTTKPGQPGYIPPPLPRRLVAGPDGEVTSSMPPLGENRFLQNEVLLQFGLNMSDADIRRIAEQLGMRVLAIETLSAFSRKLIRIALPAGMTVRQAIALLEANRFVSVAAPIYKFHLSQPAGATTKGDPAQYILNKFKLDEAHKLASGKGVTIAVIDSEVDKKHVELQGAISEELDTLTAKEPPHLHGTAMVGAIASRDRLLGVAPGARILAVRAFGESSNAEGTTLSILKGIEWAVKQNARVINMSFAGPRDPSLERALKAAHDKGVVLVAAAGNAGPKSPPLYPAADPHVIAVTATDVRDRVFRGANQGAQVSISAPGVEVLAPAPDASYQMSTGTSIATAHVSGVVALMLERDGTLQPDEVRKILEETAIDLGPKGKDAQFGWGLVNPQKALDAVAARIKSSDASKPRR